MQHILLLLLVPTATSYDQHNYKKVVNGSNANITECPYMVSVRNYGHHMCGGSILTPYHILSAAHCVVKVNTKLSIQHGVSKISRTNPHFGGNIINIVKAIPHDSYMGVYPYPNDIGVLKLESPIPFSISSSPVTLPEQNERPKARIWAVLSGWGSIGESYPSELQKVMLRVYSNEECERIHGCGISHINHLCAGVDEGWKGQCKGDSGGPLIAEDKQIGVVSWSIKPCGLIGFPGVYTKVSSYTNWIRKKLVK